MTFSYDLNNKRGLDYFKCHIGISIQKVVSDKNKKSPPKG